MLVSLLTVTDQKQLALSSASLHDSLFYTLYQETLNLKFHFRQF